jgi:hypothetical protein
MRNGKQAENETDEWVGWWFQGGLGSRITPASVFQCNSPGAMY